MPRLTYRLPATVAFLVAVGVPTASWSQAATPTAIPSAAPQPAEAWWTGPVAASSADTLPRGGILVEPYLYDVRSPGSDYIGSLTYLLYGLTDHLTVGAIPTFGSARPRAGGPARSVGVGDLTLTAQWRINRARVGAALPTVSLVVQRVLPLGRFDRLGDRSDLGIGSGAATTLLGVYAQRADRLRNGRLLRTRINLTRSLPKSASLRDESVYGTAAGFRGAARLAPVTTVDLSIEYSVSRRVAIASDLIYRATGATAVEGSVDGVPTASRTRGTRSLSVAPAVEYSWSSTRGVLLGLRVTPRSRSAPTTVTPVLAFNAVF